MTHIDETTSIDDYIAANSDLYTDDALTTQLLDAGHDRAAIDAAFARVRARRTAAASSPGAGTVLLALLLGLGYVGACVLAAFALGVGGAVTALMLVYIVAMAAGGTWSIRRLLRASTRGAGGTAIAVGLAISVVVFIGISGACFALLGPAANANGGLL